VAGKWHDKIHASLNPMAPTLTRLSKSRFVTGCQCHKLFWWTVHEPNAKELQPDKVLQDLFDQGRQVGEASSRLMCYRRKATATASCDELVTGRRTSTT